MSCDTVGRELWLATLSSLLYPEMDREEHSHRKFKSKVMRLFYDFKKSCFDVSFLTSISESAVVFTLGKVELFKEINCRNILFIGFVEFEIKQRFSAYQDQVCA